MTLKNGPLGIRVSDAYRNVPEPRIVEMLRLAGWAFEMESPTAAESCRDALQSWTEMGLGFRLVRNGDRLFDPVEVINFLKRAGLDDRDDFWAERYVHTGRRLVSELADSGQSGERQYVVDFRRKISLHSVARGTWLRLRSPLPLEGSYLCNLKVWPFAETLHSDRVDVHPGRLEVRLRAGGEKEATLGATLTFTVRPQGSDPGHDGTEPDKTMYLAHREGLIVVSEQISALARKLTKDDAPPLEAVRIFWEYIHDNLICGAVHYDQVDFDSAGDWVLQSGWYDCELGSALFVALCRASGIPARLVKGHLLYPLAPTNHCWAEAWIEDRGWAPFDFLCWDLSRGGRDPEWRDHFFARLDHRMTTERLPREFIGSIGIPVPKALSLLQVPKSGGVEISFLDHSGTPVYTDTFCVKQVR